VPQNNANGRVMFYLIPPTERPERSFYNKIKWGSIKRMAPKALEEAFGWSNDHPVNSGRSIAGNKGNILADQDNFYGTYDIDLEAMRKGDDVSYDDIKKQIGMNDFDRWKPIIQKKLAQLFLILERAWVNGAPHRIQTLKENLEQAEKTMQSLEGNLARTREELEASRTQREQALATQSKLTDVVNELVAVDYEDRSELYEEINRIAPDFGIQQIIHVRDLNSEGGKVFDSEQAAPGGALLQQGVTEVEKDVQGGENEQRENPDAEFIYLGISEKLDIDQNGNEAILKGPQAMLTNKAMNKLFLTNLSNLNGFDESINDKKADEAFEVWNSYEPNDKNYSLQWPDNAKTIPVGTADEIIYLSDKIMQPGDHEGKKHTYRHEFDAGKRPAYKKGNILIIGNLKINQRGILN
jgi:hypothetical protein